MSNHIDIVEELYGSKYKGNPLWENVVKKLTVRQAYVFYYSLNYFKKNKTAIALGIFDLPDKTAVHKCLMDALKKEENPNEAARIISDNAHKILINDNDLLWIKTELRAAIWLAYYIATFNISNKEFLLRHLRSTSEAEFVNRLIHLLDIYGCGIRGDTAQIIRTKFDNNSQGLPINYASSFNNHRSNYVSSRIADHHLNWLNKLSVDEIDAILERFEAEKILVLDGIFVPVIKKDKVALIKASLDIRQRIYINNSANESLYPYGVKGNTNTGTINQSVDGLDSVNKNKRIKKKFAELSAYEIINLLIKARRSREHRKIRSTTKNERSFTLNKEAHSILIELSNQLKAAPKKIIEALIKKVDLEDDHELLKIDKHVSGRRAVQKNSVVEAPIELEKSIEPEKPVEPDSKKKLKRKNQTQALLDFKKKQY